ncbi:hypothetical protein O6H91_08G056600 [Diphasiastrum complanatum]|uniref:Uncharacterized protein n=1 Tax=Diphasiastrum complanatum TaxID=34168 RepID=A0ACC2CXX2_DIPCM|nr:hypothetical protein O6H91_08G056600 [Diphasiastrum complanatum]
MEYSCVADGVRFLKGIAQSRWMMLVASFFVMSCAGGLYLFGLYSQEMKITLGYDQETVNNIAFFKDLGANVGIIAGLVCDFSGAWLCLLLGSIVNVFGYTMIWLAVTGRIARPAVWQMCLYIAIGANSGAFASTAVIVSGVKSFPQNRGMVVGLLKGFVGLSGAMMTQIFKAIYGTTNSSSSIILLIGWFPSFVYLVLMFVVRPMKIVQAANDKRKFYVFLGIALLLAAYLLMIILVDSLSKVKQSAQQAFAAIMILIMLLPLGVVVQTELNKTIPTGGEGENEVEIYTPQEIQQEHQQQSILRSVSSEEHQQQSITSEVVKVTDIKEATGLLSTDANKPATETESSLDNPLIPSNKQPHSTSALHDLWKTFTTELTTKPSRGEDHTIIQAISSLDFLLVFLIATLGTGTGLVVIDNLGQLGPALGYPPRRVRTFVSLVSIWNFLGRVGFGFMSEILLQRKGIPRPLFSAVICVISVIVNVVIALNVPGSLYIASMLIGVCVGALTPLLYSIVSELFGLRYFGTLFNVATLASPLGSYLLSVRAAGHLYDQEAHKQWERHRALAPAPATSALLCHGAQCYSVSLFIMAAVSVLGCLLSLILSFRTRQFYKTKRVPQLP